MSPTATPCTIFPLESLLDKEYFPNILLGFAGNNVFQILLVKSS